VKVVVIRRSPSPPLQRTLSPRSDRSNVRADYESYHKFHTQPPTPPPAPSPPQSPPFGHGEISHDPPGPWFRQNHAPHAAIAYSERGNVGSIAQEWWDNTSRSETVTSVDGEHRTYVNVRDEVVHDENGRPEKYMVVEETTRMPRTRMKGRKSKRS
jgi:hypothetical protein